MKPSRVSWKPTFIGDVFVISAGRLLTEFLASGTRTRYGGMAEWFKAAVLKTVVRKYRGFESYSLRQNNDFRRDDRVGRWCSPAKRVWGLCSTEGSNPSLSAI